MAGACASKDDGNYAAAQTEFQQAQQLDPDFAAAADEAVETGDIATAETTTATQIATTAANSGETGSSSAGRGSHHHHDRRCRRVGRG